MTIEYICREVSKLLRKYGTREPRELAQLMDITVLYEPMGAEESACKGFYLYQSRRNVIMVNSDLTAPVRRVILAHEIGHRVLHQKSSGICAYSDFSLYDSATILEYEANLFAAELLLDDESVLQSLNEDDFFFHTAKRLQVPSELLDFKFRILKKKGCQLRSPIHPGSDFLKNVT